MKTVEEVLEEMKHIDEMFPKEGNRQMRNLLKIDLFKEVPDKIFCEALRQNNTDWEDFKTIQITRHMERRK